MAFPTALVVQFAASLLISYALRPKIQKPEREGPASLEDLSVPTASEDRAVPLIMGRVWVSDPNVTWYGDLSSDPLTGNVIGYKYNLGMQMVLGYSLGSGDSQAPHGIQKILIGDKPLSWTEALTLSGDTASRDIIDGTLQGGDSEGGGVVGNLTLYSGHDTQVADEYIAAHQTTISPSNRGLLTVVLANKDKDGGMYLGTSTTLPVWKILYQQYPKNFSADKRVCGASGGVNPADALFEVLISENFGQVSPNDISKSSFLKARDVLYDEGVGISVYWNKDISAEDAINEILDHCGGILRENPYTKHIEMILVRDSNEVALVIEDDQISSVLEYTSPTPTSVTSEVIYKYVDVNNSGEPSSGSVHDLGLIRDSSLSEAVSETYDLAPDNVLASKLAVERLVYLGSSVDRLRCNTLPLVKPLGFMDKVSITYSKYGIESRNYRVVDVTPVAPGQAEVELTLVRDVFDIPVTNYIGSQAALWTGDDTSDDDTGSITGAIYDPLLESPWSIYRDYYSGNLNLQNSGKSPFLPMLGAVDNGSLVSKVGIAANGGLTNDHILDDEFNVLPSARVVLSDDTWGVDFAGAVIDYDQDYKMHKAIAGQYARIGREWVQLTSVDSVAKTLSVKRAGFHTSAGIIGKNARIVVYDHTTIVDGLFADVGVDQDAAALPNTLNGYLKLEAAPLQDIYPIALYAKPYNHNYKNLRVSGSDIIIDWDYRERTENGDRWFTDGDSSLPTGSKVKLSVQSGRLVPDATQGNILNNAPYKLSWNTYFTVTVPSTEKTATLNAGISSHIKLAAEDSWDGDIILWATPNYPSVNTGADYPPHVILRVVATTVDSTGESEQWFSFPDHVYVTSWSNYKADGVKIPSAAWYIKRAPVVAYELPMQYTNTIGGGNTDAPTITGIVTSELKNTTTVLAVVDYTIPLEIPVDQISIDWGEFNEPLEFRDTTTGGVSAATYSISREYLHSRDHTITLTFYYQSTQVGLVSLFVDKITTYTPNDLLISPHDGDHVGNPLTLVIDDAYMASLGHTSVAYHVSVGSERNSVVNATGSGTVNLSSYTGILTGEECYITMYFHNQPIGGFYKVTVGDVSPSGVPVITGATTEGQTLTADTSGISDLDGLGAFSYQWLRNNVDISGANSDTYLLVAADVGTQLSVEVSYTDGGGNNEIITSAQTAAINTAALLHYYEDGLQIGDSFARAITSSHTQPDSSSVNTVVNELSLGGGLRVHYLGSDVLSDTFVGGIIVDSTTISLASQSTSVCQSDCQPPGGTGSKTFTVSVDVWVDSGSETFRLKNTHGGVVDSFSPILTATTTPTRFAFTVNNSSASGTGAQIYGIINSEGVAKTLRYSRLQITEGSVVPDHALQAGTYNANVPAVKYYLTDMANTVSSNVVTEVAGSALPGPFFARIESGDTFTKEMPAGRTQCTVVYLSGGQQTEDIFGVYPNVTSSLFTYHEPTRTLTAAVAIDLISAIYS